MCLHCTYAYMHITQQNDKTMIGSHIYNNNNDTKGIH